MAKYKRYTRDEIIAARALCNTRHEFAKRLGCHTGYARILLDKYNLPRYSLKPDRRCKYSRHVVKAARATCPTRAAFVEKLGCPDNYAHILLSRYGLPQYSTASKPLAYTTETILSALTSSCNMNEAAQKLGMSNFGTLRPHLFRRNIGRDQYAEHMKANRRRREATKFREYARAANMAGSLSEAARCIQVSHQHIHKTLFPGDFSPKPQALRRVIYYHPKAYPLAEALCDTLDFQDTEGTGD